MIKSTQEDLLYLSSAFSKLLKRRFGKGPETCYLLSKGPRVFIYMRNFITPSEEVLIKSNELELAVTYRSTIVRLVLQEFLPEVSTILERPFASFYHDWNYDANTGLILLEDTSEQYSSEIKLPCEHLLFNVIKNVGSRGHKQPTNLKVVKYSPNMCVVESQEVLMKLENMIYEKGYTTMLFHQAMDVKRRYIEHKKLFEDVFNRLIDDMFMVWDYESDRNYLIFIFTKEEN